MMKNKLTVILIIALVALAAGDYLLGMDYLRQGRANTDMTANITAGHEALAGITPPPPDLALRLADAEEALAMARDGIPPDLNSTRIINTILRLAESWEVKAIPLVTQPWTAEKTTPPCRALRLNLALSGSFDNIAGFIGELENGEPASLVVENLRVNRADGEAVTASLDLVIYSRISARGEGVLP